MTGPKRLLESGNSELTRSLGAAQGHLPGPERLAALGERLAELGLPTTEPSGVKPTPETAAPPAPAPPPSPGGSLLLKGVAGALATGGVVLTLALARPERESHPPAPASQSSAAASSAATRERTAPAVSAKRAAPAPRAVEPMAPVVETSAAPRASAPWPEPIAAGSATGSTPPRRSVAEPAVPTTAAASPAASEAPPTAIAEATPGEASAGTGELRRAPAPSEVELLKEARRALSTAPERALLLTRRHGAEYPRGTYAQERDFIAISALSRLGRRSEAQARGDSFRARYPRSAYLPQLERLLGGR